MALEDSNAWWREARCTRSTPLLRDTNGDGVGDLRGIIERLDHLAWLGIRGVWLSPITVSPNADFGYDVADFCDVDPSLGNLADFDELVAEPRTRGIRILMDLVPNHTSIEHPWFLASRSSRDDPKRDWYVWADPKPDGSPPNNWVSSFFGPAWTLDDATGQYYLQNFLAEQADLNWWNDEVRDEFDRILRFWFDRGVAGFRIDVAHMVVKDRELRDNPPATERRPDPRAGARAAAGVQREPARGARRPPTVAGVADSYDPPRLLVGETFVHDIDDVVPYYGDRRRAAARLQHPVRAAPFEARALRGVIEQTEARCPRAARRCGPGATTTSRVPDPLGRWRPGRPGARL